MANSKERKPQTTVWHTQTQTHTHWLFCFSVRPFFLSVLVLGWQTLTALTHTHIKEDWRAGQQSALQTDHQHTHTHTHTHNCQTDSKEWRSGSFRNITIHLQNNRVISWAYQSRAEPRQTALHSEAVSLSFAWANRAITIHTRLNVHSCHTTQDKFLYSLFFPQNMREQKQSHVNILLVELQGRTIPKKVVVNTLNSTMYK